MNHLLDSVSPQACMQAEEAVEGSVFSLVILGMIYCLFVLA